MQQIESFQRDGYLLLENFLSPSEVQAALASARREEAETAAARERANASGRAAAEQPSGGLASVVVRLQRVLDLVGTALGGAPAVGASRLVMQQPLVGSGWDWHQAYGGWQSRGTGAPALISIWLGLGASLRTGIELQLLPGSQRDGRVDHMIVGGQKILGADAVAQAKSRHEVLDLEVPAGGLILIHGDCVHRYAPNSGELPRYGIHADFHAQAGQSTDPAEPLPDSALLELGRVEKSDGDYLEIESDRSVSAEGGA